MKKHVGQNEDWLLSDYSRRVSQQKFENAEGIAERDGYIIDTHPDLKGLTANQRNTCLLCQKRSRKKRLLEKKVLLNNALML